MDKINCDVFPYDYRTLVGKITTLAGLERSSDKRQIRYLKTYLGDPEVGCQTVVIEHPYIDRDYIEDYAFFYSRCFQPVSREAARLHFFCTPFSPDEWQAIIDDPSHGRLQEIKDSYLGFMVIKPLPSTYFGRTCIKNYKGEGEDGAAIKREYPVYCTYRVNVCGISLSVDTLAFQEQDHEVSACATAALWVAFHGAHRIFHNQRPTPAQITALATNQLAVERRVFPSHGLELAQMCQAVRSVGLEPEVFVYSKSTKPEKFDQCFFKALTYAYMSAGLPVILGIKIKGMGSLHACTLTGFRFYEDGKRKRLFNRSCPQSGEPRLLAHQIEKMFVNDDQVGFHARLKFVQGAPKKDFLITPWVDDEDKGRGEKKLLWAEPRFLLIPVYHKIRLSFETVYEMVKAFNDLLLLRKDEKTENNFWEVKLSTIRDFKEEIYQRGRELFNKELELENPGDALTQAGYRLKEEERKNILVKHLPRFIWRCIYYFDRQPVLEMLIDATSASRSDIICGFVVYREGAINQVYERIRDPENLKGIKKRFSEKWIDYLIKRAEKSKRTNLEARKL